MSRDRRPPRSPEPDDVDAATARAEEAVRAFVGDDTDAGDEADTGDAAEGTSAGGPGPTPPRPGLALLADLAGADAERLAADPAAMRAAIGSVGRRLARLARDAAAGDDAEQRGARDRYQTLVATLRAHGLRVPGGATEPESDTGSEAAGEPGPGAGREPHPSPAAERFRARLGGILRDAVGRLEELAAEQGIAGRGDRKEEDDPPVDR